AACPPSSSTGSWRTAARAVDPRKRRSGQRDWAARCLDGLAERAHAPRLHGEGLHAKQRRVAPVGRPGGSVDSRESGIAPSANAAVDARLRRRGVACVVNAAHCGRVHCYVTGPLYLLAAIATLLAGMEFVPLRSS